MRLTAVTLLVALTATGEDKKPKLAVDVQEVLDLALAAPPEFAASAILRLVESGKIPSAVQKKQHIESAFELAGRAQHPIRLVALPGSGTDTRSGYLASALRLRLDALSLQSRAVDDMLNLDKAAARALFERSAAPAVDAAGCESPLVPDATAYYDMVTRLAAEAYTGADGEKNSRLAFGQVVMDRVRSHVELAPAARMLAAVDWSASQFEILSGAFAAKMQSLAPDDRSFSLSARHTEPALAALTARARQYNTRPERIAEAYRAYLVRNLNAARCAGGGTLELFGEAVRGELPPLLEDELRPSKTGAEPKLERYWESDEARRIFEQCRSLRTGADGMNLTEAARGTREWRRQLSDFLSLLSGWKPAAEASEADYYHQRAIVYEALLELTPPGEVRARVLDEYVAFLKNSNLQQLDAVEWFWHARSTLNRIRPTQPAEAQRMLAAFASSGNIVLALEALLDRVAPDYSMFPN